MAQHSLSWQHSLISYHRFGHGTEWVFAFHGYGENGGSFAVFEPLLGDRYTLIAIDLPFHGLTEWKEPTPLVAADLQQIIDSIAGNRQRFILMGFSMGGRIALSLMEQVPERVERVFLAAPDGLHQNPWHFLSTQTWLGNRIFRYTMSHPGWLFAAMKIFARVGWFDKTIFYFAHYYLDEPQSRRLLYHRWTLLRKFDTPVRRLRRTIRQHAIPVTMVFGHYDKVIPPRHGHILQRGLETWVTVYEIEAGHQLLREKHAAEIARLFSGK